MRKAQPIMLVLLLILGAGCGGGDPAPPPEEAPGVPAPAPAPPPQDVMEGVSLDLFPDPDTTQQNVKPLLSIQAARVTRSGEDTNTLTFEGAEAVVPSQTPGAREIRFSAARGVFVEGVRAELSGGVTARINEMTITLEDIIWEILPEEGDAGGSVARSDNKLQITSPTQNLVADSLRLDTAAETIELQNVVGEFTFIGEAP